jgi:hypothetical protein
VLRNQEKATATTDLWLTYMKDPNTANLPTPAVTFTTDTSPAAVAAFMGNQPVTSQSVTVGGNTYTDASLEQAQQAALPAVKTPAKTPAPGAPGGPAVINSSGAQQPAAAAAPPSSSLFSSIPVWGWAVAAGAALVIFGGGNGR